MLPAVPEKGRRTDNALIVLSALATDLGNMEISPFNRELPLLKALPVPFEDVTIAREMRQFSAALGLTPNIPAAPSLNIVASIVFGRTSFEAVVRRELGDVEFRNLRNYAIGKVKKPRSLGSILVKFGGNQELLEQVASVLRDSENSNFVQMVAALEGAAYRLMLFIRSIPVPCPCCGSNLISNPEKWWGAQPCDISSSEAALVDRACLVAVAIHFLISWRDKSKNFPPPTIRQLANASAHPYKNWLARVSEILKAPDLAHLAVRAEADLEPDSIWRYARGETLTQEAVEMLIARIPHSGSIQAAVIPARTLAFAIELLRAAHRSAPLDDSTVRKIVSDRVGTILGELSAIGHFTKEMKLRISKLTPATFE